MRSSSTTEPLTRETKTQQRWRLRNQATLTKAAMAGLRANITQSAEDNRAEPQVPDRPRLLIALDFMMREVAAHHDEDPESRNL